MSEQAAQKPGSAWRAAGENNRKMLKRWTALKDQKHSITHRAPEGMFSFPIREVDQQTRDLIDTALAERGKRNGCT